VAPPVSCSCPPWLVVVLSPVNLQLCDIHPPSPLPPLVGCCDFRPLRHLSLLLRGLSSHCAIPTRSTSHRHLVRLVVASPPSCLAGYCIASPHAATSHLTVPPPLITPLPIIMPLSVPLPLVPLVWMIFALPLLTTPLPRGWQWRGPWQGRWWWWWR
jgi:hypothetical protein